MKESEVTVGRGTGRRRASCGRREFLLGAAATTALAGCATGGRLGGFAPKFGFCTWSFDLIPKAAAAGADFFEMSVTNLLCPEKDDAWWQKRRDEIRAMPLPVWSCNGFIPGKFRLTGPKADPEPALRYGEIALRRAEEVGIRTIVFGSGGARNVPGDFVNGPQPDILKGVRQFTDFCRELCRRCADLKTVQVVLEPLSPNESNFLNFVWQGVQIADDIASPRLAVLADLYHMTAGRESPASIELAGARLKHVHIADPDSRHYVGSDRRLTDRLIPYFQALKSIGYAGGISCECGWGKDIAKEYVIALNTLKELAS